MNAISYSAAERETTLQTDDERGFWRLETYQPKIQTKLRKVGIEPLSVREDGQCIYKLDFNQVSFRSGKKRVMSDEQRKKNSDRLKKMHEKRNEVKEND